ncbi:protease [Streptomyces camponoticapitis]|uniref:Protease n=1 Tax=Streptomyces camponoticapitis TaxID=1616125 RepID=A0ABQ2E0C5_9ACTN|nr:trypsin-like peptidase domain-containing protein [Streptomyces camponoticapitis]GGJ83033.1 protease [Streptomyces camponoticapitis]
MSTENEGTAVPSAPSVPPVPVAAPEGTPASAPREFTHERQHAGQGGYASHGGDPDQPGRPGEPGHGSEPTTQLPGAVPAYHPGSTGPRGSAPNAGWPPPPPPPNQPHYGGGGGWGEPPASGPQPSRKRPGGLIAAVLASALVAGVVGGGIGFWAADNSDDSVGGGSSTISAADPALKREAGSTAAVAGEALPSVVTITAQAQGGDGGTGTGFIYDKQGHILTNNHVVASAADGGDLTATFSNGKEYAAEVVGRAEGYDVAVMKLKDPPSGLKPLALGNSDKVAVGDSTIAIGAPFGLSNTVTTGIISAKNRPVASGDGTSDKNSYMSALQTDASINPGNSGGPLLDARGAVIGMNSAIQPTGGGGGGGGAQSGSVGLGFAIPINQARTVAGELIKTGQPVYPVIGATVSMTEGGDGATISGDDAGGTPAVTPDGPAAKAGLKSGDVITKFNNVQIDSGPTLISEIWTHKPGDKIKITYTRDGKESQVDVTLGERKGDTR